MKTDSSFQVANNELDFWHENPMTAGEEEQMKEALKAFEDYEEALQEIYNRGIFLSPLKNQKIVLSSRIEGTFCTLDGMMLRNSELRNIGRIDNQAVRPACIKTYLYKCAMDTAHKQVSEGNLLTKGFLICANKKIIEISSHATNACHDNNFSPSENFDISPTWLDTSAAPSTANRNLNDILGLIAITPVDFFCHAYFVNHSSEPTNKMWELRTQGADLEKNRIHLGAWRYYFLVVMEHSAIHNMEMAKSILELHDAMKPRFAMTLSAKLAEVVIKFAFSSPIFSISSLANSAKIPVGTATQLVKQLLEENLVQVAHKSNESESAVYSFDALMRLIRV